MKYRKTVLLSLGVFASGVIWTVYDTYVPLILNTYVTSTFLIGLVAALMSLAGTALHPVFGTLSDSAGTRFGRRFIFLLAGMPISAAALLFIPAARHIAGLPHNCAGYDLSPLVWTLTRL